MTNTDPRWIDWARGVCEGATLSQRKWSGRGRPFRRSEYEEGVRTLTSAGYLIFLKRRGYRPNRAAGWGYIHHMARGDVSLPPPPPGTSAGIKNSSVRRARTAPRTGSRMILRRKEGPMKTVLAHQGPNKTIFYLYNDRGKCVARMEKPYFLSVEEQQKYAEEYRRAHPQDFPGEKFEVRHE